MAYVSDSTRTSLGRRRPFFVVAPVIYCSLLAMLLIPPGSEDAGAGFVHHENMTAAERQIACDGASRWAQTLDPIMSSLRGRRWSQRDVRVAQQRQPLHSVPRRIYHPLTHPVPNHPLTHPLTQPRRSRDVCTPDCPPVRTRAIKASVGPARMRSELVFRQTYRLTFHSVQTDLQTGLPQAGDPPASDGCSFRPRSPRHPRLDDRRLHPSLSPNLPSPPPSLVPPAWVLLGGNSAGDFNYGVWFGVLYILFFGADTFLCIPYYAMQYEIAKAKPRCPVSRLRLRLRPPRSPHRWPTTFYICPTICTQQ